MTYSLRFHAQSHVGRIRKNNQDSGYASPTMLVVCDGMGGAAAGDLASAVAATMAKKLDKRVEGDEMLTYMGGVVNRGNDRLAELVDEDPTLDGMGTTFCGAAFDGEQLGIAHIGDSRLYRLRDGELEQLTHDHSWVQSLIDEGRITPEQAATHPHRSLILKVLNGQAEPEPDYELSTVELGDRFLFCSDGLSGLISDQHIEALLAGYEDLDELAEELIAAAIEAGGHDNITVVLADIVEQDEALDKAPSSIVGSATERKIPKVGELTASQTALGEGYPEPAESPDDEEAEEKARYAPAAAKVRWPSVVIAAALIIVVLAGAVWGVAAYAQSRYYIAEADGNIGIYNGIPGSILSWELHSLTERRDTPIENLPRFYQRAVKNTIGVQSAAAARETADELEEIAEQCMLVREQRASETPEPTPSPSTSPGDDAGNPNYPTVIAPVTPTATEEADPEAC